MKYFDAHKDTYNNLMNVSNPIIRYNLLKMTNNITVDDYTKVMAHPDVINWLDKYNGIDIHGSKDGAFENSLAKLLEFGLDRTCDSISQVYDEFLGQSHWSTDKTFYSELMATVKYPFLIKAGYFNEQPIKDYFIKRLEVIESTIEKRGSMIEMEQSEKPDKYRDDFVFNIDIRNEWLPTIYDLYAFSAIDYSDKVLRTRIEKIVEYVLTDEFQSIPDKAYIYDRIKKRYFAAGSVYHACYREERSLLMIVLLSRFKAARANTRFMDKVEELLNTKDDNGYFNFGKDVIKEKKNSYYIYNGSHMGLGENRRGKDWLKIESSYWMMRILDNMDYI